ncbi:MAG: glycine cleavage system protein T, partial [Alphaproteobacteria bacterium]|nr:glycine cleavage system protein T [Alphaproteobacteria bacterium]
FQPRIRKSAFFNAARRHGCQHFTVYNRTYTSLGFDDPVAEYWHLINHVALWPAAGERQVEITGPDAARFVQLLTPRNLDRCAVGQGKYVLITSPDGGVLNDPVLLRLGQNHFWLSIADSEILLWARGVAVFAGMNVMIRDPSVTVIQVQGPKSIEVMADLFGPKIRDLRYYWITDGGLGDIPLTISRTGWSSEWGYELFLRDFDRGDELFDRLLEAGKPYDMRPGSTSQIRRVEGALLSLGADMTSDDNPYELGLDRLIDLDQPAEFIGKAALARIKAKGVKRKLIGLRIEGDKVPPNIEHWPLMIGDRRVGRLSSLAFSPRLGCNIALGMTAIEYAATGTRHIVESPYGEREATVADLPFVPRRQTG